MGCGSWGGGLGGQTNDKLPYIYIYIHVFVFYMRGQIIKNDTGETLHTVKTEDIQQTYLKLIDDFQMFTILTLKWHPGSPEAFKTLLVLDHF